MKGGADYEENKVYEKNAGRQVKRHMHDEICARFMGVRTVRKNRV